MNSAQDTAKPVAPASRAMISGYTVHSSRRLAGVVDQMCLDGLLEDHAERAADRFTRRTRVSHHHGEHVVWRCSASTALDGSPGARCGR